MFSMPPGVTLEQMLRVMSNSEPPAPEVAESRKRASKKAPPVEVERARDDDGKFLADDPATPDVDEAWVEPDREN
jgi:hypothetical protein